MAFPVFQAAGTPIASTSEAISPVWPAHQAGDVGLLLVESSHFHLRLPDPQGFKMVPSGAQTSGNHNTTSGTYLAVYWCRATSDAMPAPTVEWASGHVRAVILTFRGCAAVGNPFNVSAGDSVSAAATAVSVPGGTTTHADCLIVSIVSDSTLTTSAQFTGWANADLANVTEILDSHAAIGNGSGFGVATGQKAAAGAFGPTTATSGVNTFQGRVMVALTAVSTAEDKTPYLKQIGQFVERDTAGTLEPAWPPHQAGDVGILIVGTGAAFTMANAQGFTQIGTTQIAGSGNAAAGLALFWKRATGSSEPAPSINFGSNHMRAVIMTFGGCVAAGSPIDASALDATSATSTAVSIPGATTTKPNCLVFQALSDSTDLGPNIRHNLISWANAALDNAHEVWEDGSFIGAGNHLYFGLGRKPTAGAFGATTATLVAADSQQARGTIALLGQLSQHLIAERGAIPVTFNPANLRITRRLRAETGVIPFAGGDADFTVSIRKTLIAETHHIPVTGGNATFRRSLGGGWTRAEETDTEWVKQDPLA